VPFQSLTASRIFILSKPQVRSADMASSSTSVSFKEELRLQKQNSSVSHVTASGDVPDPIYSLDGREGDTSLSLGIALDDSNPISFSDQSSGGIDVGIDLFDNSLRITRRNAPISRDGFRIPRCSVDLFTTALANQGIDGKAVLREYFIETLHGLGEEALELRRQQDAVIYGKITDRTVKKNKKESMAFQMASPALKALTNMNDEWERKAKNEIDLYYPRDCYSLIALNGPTKQGWSRRRMGFFLFGILVFLFQLLYLSVLLMGIRYYKGGTGVEDDAPERRYNWEFGMNKFLTQIVAIIGYSLLPDSTLQDLVVGFQLWPDAGVSGSQVKCMRLSCILRIVQGTFAFALTFFLITTQKNPIEVILGFTAMNYVSSLDDSAFLLAGSGVFGVGLKEEVERIENCKLDGCMFRKAKHVFYWIVMFCCFVAAITAFAVVMFREKNIRMFRVEFEDEPGLQKYSGCYELDGILRPLQGNSYKYFDQNISHASIDYCDKEHRWILSKGKEAIVDACTEIENGDALAFSSVVDSSALLQSFDGEWTSPSGAGLQMRFFSDENDLHCDIAKGDGKCDSIFNIPKYGFDDGDCCAATCTGSACETRNVATVFGQANISAAVFPDCKDPKMFPITIHLNDIASSHDPGRAVFHNSSVELHQHAAKEYAWKMYNPASTNIALECNGINVLSVNIEQSMENSSESVMVEDGADCTLAVTNSSIYPRWGIDYTIFHGEIGKERIEIMTQNSNEIEAVKFKRIPECYIQRLKEHLDLETIYTSSGPSQNAINWLIDDDSEHFRCEDEFLIERYLLSTVDFTINTKEKFINERGQCAWSRINCVEGSVTEIDLNNQNIGNLSADILKILVHFENLSLLNVDSNEIAYIPNEIGSLTNLQHLSFASNSITSIPTEIMSLGKLKSLYLNDNKISFVSSEIEALTNLEVLHLGNNELSSIPDDILGSLTNLKLLILSGNDLIDYPSLCFSTLHELECILD